MNHLQPAFAVTLNDQDITAKIYPHQVSQTLTESREDTPTHGQINEQQGRNHANGDDLA